MNLLRRATREFSELAPLDAVIKLGDAADGTPIFDASGDDPKMIWRPGAADRANLESHGMVRVRIELETILGPLREPCVYFDWGDGFTEETRRPLSLTASGHYRGVGQTNAGSCRAIRFDPSAGPCRFNVRSFVVEGLGAAAGKVPRLSAPRRLVRRVLRRLPDRLQRGLRQAKGIVTDSGDAAGHQLFRRFLSLPSRNSWKDAYLARFQMAQNGRSPLFAAPPLEPPRRAAEEAKVVAFYLPQFHAVPENDAWWGKGFTEWTNVGKAMAQFVDHLQPRLPADLGYYDLRNPEVQRAQARLARLTGVEAFCFHYYWFAGRRILEGPLDSFVADPEIDLPFALCWANENWTRRWDGLETDVLLAQQHSPEDDLAVFDDITRYMRNPRYLRVEGRPLLIVYRPDTLPEPAETVKRWRGAARASGLGELFILCTDAFGFSDYAGCGFDGIVEFPPHAISIGEITHRIDRLNPSFSGRVYSYEAVVAAKEADLSLADDPMRYPGVMPSWDNEARKPGAGHVFHAATPELFYRWMRAAFDFSRRVVHPGRRMVFVNAWNEWAEGTYLEPDRWFGHGFAQALRASLEAGAPKIDLSHPAISAPRQTARTSDLIILLHLYYPDLIEDVRGRLASSIALADMAISFPDTWSPTEVERLATAFPTAMLSPCPNRGRDVEPFLRLLALAKAGKYPIFLKLHSKRSPHLADGEAARGQLFEELASPGAMRNATALFAGDEKLGVVAPASSERRLGEAGVMQNNAENLAFLASRLGFRFGADTRFPAGTMFWGRVAAFEALLGEAAASLPFESEMGRIDGTLAHALERAMDAIASAAGYSSRYVL